MTTQTSTDFRFGTGLRNHFLVAMPYLNDPLFTHSITYICDHTPKGAMGLVINRPMDILLSDVFDQMELQYDDHLGRAPVLAGGPVNTQRGFVLHPTGGEWASSMPLLPGLSLTASRDILAAMAQGQGPHEALVALGYAGWSEGQLEQEIKDNSWLTLPADLDILFNTPAEQRWHAAAMRLGINLNLMPNQAGHA